MMKMRIIFPDSSWFLGDRDSKAMGGFINHETKGTHHFFVLDGDESFKPLIGQELAVPINQVKYFIMNPTEKYLS